MSEEQTALRELNAKLRIVLPPEYEASYEDVQPVSMGTAGLRFDDAGRVAWGDMWETFCNLAMAGGPPHKGKLLEPATEAEIAAQPELYRTVVAEICRGIRLVSDLAVDVSPDPGWVRVFCPTRVMAGWLVRAIVMENVSARMRDEAVELPAGPHYRVEKEIKNVITVIAKTAHYFDGHLEYGQEQKIAAIFKAAEAKAGLLQPADRAADATWKDGIAERLLEATGLHAGGVPYGGWLGLQTGSVHSAIWMMRALAVSNVLARREETFLYVPLNEGTDPDGQILVSAVAAVKRLAAARGL